MELTLIESTTGIKKSNKQTEARKSERQKIRLRSTDEKKKLSSGVPMELKIIRLRSPDEKKIMSQSRHRERPRFFFFIIF